MIHTPRRPRCAYPGAFYYTAEIVHCQGRILPVHTAGNPFLAARGLLEEPLSK